MQRCCSRLWGEQISAWHAPIGTIERESSDQLTCDQDLAPLSEFLYAPYFGAGTEFPFFGVGVIVTRRENSHNIGIEDCASRRSKYIGSFMK